MSTLFSDNFNRADNSTVSATNWTENGTSQWSIVSNAVNCSGAGAFFLITTTSAHAAVADCKASVTITNNTTLDGGPMVRATSTGAQGYFADIIAGSSLVNLWRRVSSSDTQIGGDITGLTINIGDVFTLEASGTGATVTLKIYQNGAQIGSNFTDSSGSRLTGTGQTGIAHFAPAGASWDDFLAEDLAGTPVTITPSAGSVALSGVAANLVTGISRTASVGALALAGIAALVTQQDIRTPSSDALSLSGNAPTVVVPGSRIPSSGALNLSGIAPAVTQQLARIPAVGSITLTGIAPSVTRTLSIAPSAGSLAFTGYDSPQTLGVAPPTAGALLLSGIAPTVTTGSGPVTVTPLKGTLTLSGNAPTLNGAVSVNPSTGAMAFTGMLAGVTQQVNRTATIGSLTLAGVAPGITQQALRAPNTGALALSGNVPTINAPRLLTPGSGQISLIPVVANVSSSQALLETIPYLIGAEEYSARQMLSSIYMVTAVIGSGGTVTAQSVDAFTQAVRGSTVTITMGGAIYVPPRSSGRNGTPPYGSGIA